jgi:hypothetical protein
VEGTDTRRWSNGYRDGLRPPPKVLANVVRRHGVRIRSNCCHRYIKTAARPHKENEMTSLDPMSHLLEVRLRTERATKRATLLASLGPLPKPQPLRLLRRRTVQLAAPVEIRHAAAKRASKMPPRAA